MTSSVNRDATTSEEFVANALLLLRRLQDSKDDGVASSAVRFVQARMVDEAQVWATLATVPEPLEPLTATAELISAPTLGAVFPKLMCPHGYQARLVPLSTEEINEVNFPTTLHYTFSPDCEICP